MVSIIDDSKPSENTEEEKRERQLSPGGIGKVNHDTDVSKLLAVNTSLGDENLLNNTVDKVVEKHEIHENKEKIEIQDTENIETKNVNPVQKLNFNSLLMKDEKFYNSIFQ